MSAFEVDREACLARFLRLTAIPGKSGEEKQVADAVVELLREAGLDDQQISFDGAETRTALKGDCGNLIVTLPGNGSGPRTMLSAHLDTVPICQGSRPVVESDHVWSDSDTGLGADNRSGCAAILSAAIERLARGDEQFDPAVLVFFVQEEIGIKGSRELDTGRLGKVDFAFNFDGGRLDKITSGATGGERIDIELRGIPSHAGVAPEKGVSAIVIAARAIADLNERGWLGRIEKPEGEGTSNVGIISGGDATNVLTPLVKLRAEARSHNAAMRKRIVQEMRQAFESAAEQTKNDEGDAGACKFDSHVDYESFQLSDDDPSIVMLQETLEKLGRSPFTEVAGGGLDANNLHEFGIAAPTVGCGQKNIHTADEQLDLRDYYDACQLAAMLITGGPQ